EAGLILQVNESLTGVKLAHPVTWHIHLEPYFTSSSEQESALPDREGWLVPGIVSNPFLGLISARLQRGLTSVNSHHIEKRKCNTATCVTQRLADFLTRSSNTIGTVYAPTNVGSNTYGKRDLLQPPGYLPL
uniref:Calcitonin peptide-like domain-containing protein n=1 Tax=Oncorhynchus tshawytscha TaxID=74940 RepID=A0AAZ3Q371_ONCTS